MRNFTSPWNRLSNIIIARCYSFVNVFGNIYWNQGYVLKRNFYPPGIVFAGGCFYFIRNELPLGFLNFFAKARFTKHKMDATRAGGDCPYNFNLQIIQRRLWRESSFYGFQSFGFYVPILIILIYQMSSFKWFLLLCLSFLSAPIIIYSSVYGYKKNQGHKYFLLLLLFQPVLVILRFLSHNRRLSYFELPCQWTNLIVSSSQAAN